MIKKLTFVVLLTLALASLAEAQTTNTPSPATRKRTVNATPNPQPSTAQDEATKQTGNKQAAKKKDPASPNVLEVFEALLDGIRAADVKVVTGIYWNSPQLVLFNNNGTVTKGWEQMRKNRDSSYPDMKDVVLEVRDVRVQMLGREGALITCQWTQSQNFRGAEETASGRMTLAFKLVGKAWKAIHLHTSPDAPDPSRVMPSEQTTPAPKP
ncbi:MAG: nuclear transport factor 2 family protein [Pyrinomonadaceae bacterium]|nr:nuclear transport factor 2 family protein [Pyrinomonadaceae bacterium]